MDIWTQDKILITFNSKLTRLAEINKAVHQGFPLSPILFNIYLNEIISKCQKEDLKWIPLSRNQQMLMLLFVDDQVIIFNIEDNLQKAAYKLKKNRKQLNYICRENKTNGI